MTLAKYKYKLAKLLIECGFLKESIGEKIITTWLKSGYQGGLPMPIVKMEEAVFEKYKSSLNKEGINSREQLSIKNSIFTNWLLGLTP